jgi:GT2 family glycosyltransferase
MSLSTATPVTPNKLAFVVATKDRPDEIRTLMKNLSSQSRRPDELIIVDGSDAPLDEASLPKGAFPVKYLRSRPPSASRQRNVGLGAVAPEINLIGFLDDDVVLETHAVENMMEFWKSCPEDVGGVSFNLLNHPPLYAADLKSLPLAEKLGLYSRERGRVLPSGFQTMLGRTDETVFVQWLPSGASIWRREVFSRISFDEWFKGYSYLEDLDFSYRVGKSFRLAVLGGAGYRHYPAPGGRGSGYQFGAREVLHRLHFVAKHSELSLMKCVIGLGVRFLMNLIMSVREKNPYYLQRALGNMAGLGRSLWNSQRRIS